MADKTEPIDDGGIRPLGDGSHLEPEGTEITSSNKITGEELQARIAQRRQAQRDKRAESRAKRNPVFSLARTAVTVVAVAGAIGSIFYVSGTSGSHDEQVQANSAEISELEASIEEIKNSSRASADADTISNGLTTARERAESLAEIQNAMATTRNMPEMSDDEAVAITEEYSLQVDNAKSYLSRAARSGGTFSPQQRWIAPVEFVIDKDDPTDRGVFVPMNAEMFAWTAQPTYSVDPETAHVRSLWTANMTQGEYAGQLLAWVTGTFNPSTGVFSNMRMALTPFGQEMVGATVSPPGAGYGDGLEESERRADVLRELAEMNERDQNERARERSIEREESGESGAADAETDTQTDADTETEETDPAGNEAAESDDDAAGANMDEAVNAAATEMGS